MQCTSTCGNLERETWVPVLGFYRAWREQRGESREERERERAVKIQN